MGSTLLQRARSAATFLTESMLDLFSDHTDECLDTFVDDIKILFPEDSRRKWRFNKRQTSVGRTAVDLSYEVDGLPYIIMEVKLEFGSGGDSHIQVQSYYQIYLKNNPDRWLNGAPMFLLTLIGNSDLFTS